LLFGYGSYEMLRGGFELDYNNIFGRAHHARLRATQSFKSSSGDYTYTIPELIRSEIDVFFNASALRREEISFTREELTVNAGLHRYYRPIFSDASLRYSYQVLSATDIDVPPTEGRASANVGAFIGDFKHDRRDNPLYPRKGYKVFANLEVASDSLAGDANYQRFEVATSLHQPLGRGHWLHLGVTHGALFPVGDRAENLPFNKRFFPGGENSVRGFQQGEAAPRDADGTVLGAESYVTVNIELEQALTPAWSVVVFLDSIGFARRISDYPFDEELYSAGGGLRWKTLIGPVRLEYGYNLNPRAHDPSGTLHFSLGFPF
jgi:outer membrane translocation and assembly module TamA